MLVIIESMSEYLFVSVELAEVTDAKLADLWRKRKQYRRQKEIFEEGIKYTQVHIGGKCEGKKLISIILLYASQAFINPSSSIWEGGNFSNFCLRVNYLKSQ